MAPAATVPSASSAFIEHGLKVARAAMEADAATCSHKSIKSGRDAYRSYVAAVESLVRPCNGAGCGGGGWRAGGKMRPGGNSSVVTFGPRG